MIRVSANRCRSGQLLDVVEDRTARTVTSWLARRDPGWLARIGVVARPVSRVREELVSGLFRADTVDDGRDLLNLIDAWAATIDAPE